MRLSLASSFSPVVLLLKIVMAQQGLDKPFTGGLGSYKLYVLVAYHVSMECDHSFDYFAADDFLS
jgi:hypothetical protein